MSGDWYGHAEKVDVDVNEDCVKYKARSQRSYSRATAAQTECVRVTGPSTDHMQTRNTVSFTTQMVVHELVGLATCLERSTRVPYGVF